MYAAALFVCRLTPTAPEAFVSAKTGEGLDAWLDWLRSAMRQFKTGEMEAPKHYDA